MKKALKKILALVATGAMAISAFAMSASAYEPSYAAQRYGGYCSTCGKSFYGSVGGHYVDGVWHPYDNYKGYGYVDKYGNWCWYDWVDVNDYCYSNGYYDANGVWHSYSYYDGYYGYYSAVYLTAENWNGGKVTAKVPSGATNVSYAWSGDVSGSGSEVRLSKTGLYTVTCTATFTYKVGSNRTVTDTVSATIRGDAYSSEGDAVRYGGSNKYVYSSNYGYYYDCDKYPCDYYYYPSYTRPSYTSRVEYEVDWDTDTFYYNGRKQVPSATVTIGKRTIDLDVKIISGDKDSTDVGSYRASASLPSGYRGYKLSGSTLRYTIEEPLKQGLTSENGGTYYYNNGKAETGWKTVSGDTYYFEKNGKAATGWEKLDGNWYYFDNSGVMQTGWVRSNGQTYYTNDSGVMIASKWMKMDGYWYYFGESGAMAESEWVKTGGKWYYLSADGKMATNTTIPGGYRVDANGVWVK